MDATVLAQRMLQAVPANRTAGIEVLSAVDGTGRAAVTTPESMTNVIGSMHASGLVGLLDTVGLAAIISACRSEQEAATLLPLGAAASMEFRSPGRGRLVAVCRLDDDARTSLTDLFESGNPRARLDTDAEIVDEGGTLICRGTFRWSVRRLPVTTPSR